MKDYAIYQGINTIGGCREATHEALELKLITGEKIWIDMISSRSKALIAYDDKITEEIYPKILNKYDPAFLAFQKLMEAKRIGKQANL